MSVNTIPESHLDLLTGPVYAVLTTIAPDGQPENTVVWCSWDGRHVLVNTEASRRKPQNVKNNPKVALTAMDPQNHYRWIDVRGSVVEVVDDTDLRNINAHARLYTGKDKYFGGVLPAELEAQQKRVILKIKPERVLPFAPPS